MISDESDEDANNLADEIVLGTVIGHDSPARGTSAAGPATVSDWPLPRVKDIGFDLDHATLAWFKANHPDWREAIGFVLQAWVTLKTQAEPDVQLQG
jgi:hypothetical protein